MAVPYTFGNATTSIPLSQLDSNFATAITLGNTAVYLGNTTTSFGNVTLTNVTISSGNATLTKVTTPTVDAGSGNALTLQSNSTTGLYIDTSQNVGIGTTAATTIGTANGWPGFVVGSGTGSWGATIYSGAAANGGLAFANGTTTTATYNGYISYNHNNNAMTFATNGGTERMRIDSSGNLLIGTTSLGTVNSNSYSLSVSNAYQTINHINGTASGAGYVVFGYNGSLIGSITQNGTAAVAYNTSSDYRLKENVMPMTNGLAKIEALKPVTYDWISDKSYGEGFIAHELAEIIPYAVTGEKDAVNEDGSIKPQGVDYSKIVVHLVAAIQELSAKVTALEAKVGA